MEAELQQMSQAEFARAMGVSRAAVSQWKSKDILRGDAFTKPGKSGKVIYQVAVEQVRRNRDIGQSLGNGIATRTTAGTPAQEATVAGAGSGGGDQPALALPQASTADVAPLQEAASIPGPAAGGAPKAITVEDQLKLAKLEEQLRRNRMQSAEEALRQGMLMSADDAREQMTRVAGMMMQIFEGALTDFAAVLASQFDIPQRDALHLLKNEFRNVRKTATMKQRALASETPKEVTTNLELKS
ncbi:hypothetical protein [Thalassovita aquimarina]|uniref:HTH cro/C1-type domain-containing protein n=1 Tax=Thalassovita aquimarina TaxID=2785917 RepID=A0ABS5HTI0_9RHOB|nr:hypothetical protein [Thalassovita aquimarina]MBR9651903.1 hypothetical protein [Thalassovita aquimarina]